MILARFLFIPYIHCFNFTFAAFQQMIHQPPPDMYANKQQFSPYHNNNNNNGQQDPRNHFQSPQEYPPPPLSHNPNPNSSVKNFEMMRGGQYMGGQWREPSNCDMKQLKPGRSPIPGLSPKHPNFQRSPSKPNGGTDGESIWNYAQQHPQQQPSNFSFESSQAKDNFLRSDSLLTSTDDDVPYDSMSNNNFGPIGNIPIIKTNGQNFNLKQNFGNGAKRFDGSPNKMIGKNFYNTGGEQSAEYFNHATGPPSLQMHELAVELSRMAEKKPSPQQKKVGSPADIHKNGKVMYNLNPIDYNAMQKELKVSVFQYELFLRFIYNCFLQMTPNSSNSSLSLDMSMNSSNNATLASIDSPLGGVWNEMFDSKMWNNKNGSKKLDDCFEDSINGLWDLLKEE